MYVFTSKGAGIGLMLAALCFLGTWPAIFNLLERRGRNPSHTFLDYCIANFLVAIFIALTFGQIGHSTPATPNFITQLSQDNGPSIGFAFGGGIFLFFGNLATQYSLAFVGLSVTEVVASSITVVGGTTLNYFLDDRINNAAVLFPGVGMFLIASLLGSALHMSNMEDIDLKMGIKRKGFFVDKSLARNREAGAGPGMTPPVGFEQPKVTAAVSGDPEAAYSKVAALDKVSGKPGASAGSAEFLLDLEDKRAIKVSKHGKLVGLCITITAGLCYTVFSPGFNLAVNDQWHKLKPGVPHLVVYTAFFWFSLAFFICAWIVNVFFLYYPQLGLPRSSLMNYARDWKGRGWALLAGVLCGWGNGFQFMGGQAAGYAAADSVQALPLVSTFWGILIFHEYRRSSPRTYVLLGLMLGAFATAVGLLMGSAGSRQHN